LLSVPGSQCLASHAAAPDGEGAFGWECDEASDDQEWLFDRQRSALFIRRAYAGDNTPRCLDVDTTSGADVQIWSCHYGANQQWQFRRILIRGYGGLCATRPDSGPGDVTMQPCTGAATQLWRLEPGNIDEAFRLRAESAYLCLAARGSPGSAVGVETCGLENVAFLPLVLTAKAQAGTASDAAAAAPGAAAPAALEFYLMSGGQLRPAAMSGQCLDVRDVWDSDYTAGEGGPAPGQAVQVFDCYDSQLNQKWSFSGDVVSGDQCLTLSGNNLANGAAAIVAACNGSVNQDWDYYP
jgi:hypothetical protein